MKTISFAGRSWVLHPPVVRLAPPQRESFAFMGFSLGLPCCCWKCSLEKCLISSVPVLCSDGRFAVNQCLSDSFVSALQEELLILSRLMNLHFPPGSLEGSLFFLYGDRYPHCSDLPLSTALQVFSSCANLLSCCELSSAGCECVSTVSIGCLFLAVACFFPAYGC